jgi:GT2 family glycosyltransferase
MSIPRKISSFLKKINRVNELEKQFKKGISKSVPIWATQEIDFKFSQDPKVSIIIPFYNESQYTLNCLHYLHNNLTQNHSFEIILIDDNSTENYDFSSITGIHIIRNKENLGFLRNINKGIQNAKGEYIYILNNDTEVQENFLDELFYVFENFPNVGAVGSKLINSNGSLQEAGSLIMKNCNIRQIVRKKEVFYPEVNYIYKVDYCSGCSLLFKKHNENGELNLFDEQFTPAYFEETDFCFQLKYLQNKNVYYTPFSKVLHYNGVTYNSQKNTDTDKLKRKDELFKINLEKFKNKWQNQLDSIQSTTIEDRIQEIYNHKSIAIFCNLIPEFDKDSGSNRLKEIIEAFTELDYHVTLIKKNTFNTNTYIEYFQRKGVNVFFEHKKLSGISKYLKNQKLNSKIAWFYGPVIFVKKYKIAKKYFPNAKLIFDMVDIHHLRIQRAIKIEPHRISLRKKYHKYKTKELQACKIADYVIAISDFDKNYMKQFCDENKIVIISNIHYVKIKKEQALPFEERKDILFIGSCHSPNINALHYLENEIMPLVWEKLPEIKVNVIGNVSAKIVDLQNPNFIFHGYVPDIELFFITNKLMVAPLLFGAGVKGKIGQAFEYYLPVITSSIGAEGMDLVNGTNALIDDTKEGFATAIIKLYSDQILWQKLQDNSENSLKPFSKEKLKSTILEIGKI